MGAGIALLGFPLTLCLGVSFPKFGVIFESTCRLSSFEGLLIRLLRLPLGLINDDDVLCD